MEKWMSVEDAASHLGVTDRTIYRRIEKDKIKSKDVNGERQVCVIVDEASEPEATFLDDNEVVVQLRSEIEFLRQQNVDFCQKESETVTQLREEIQTLSQQNEAQCHNESQIVGHFQTEIDHLRQQNDHLTQLLAMKEKNLQSIAEQLQTKDLMLEDMRQKPQTRWEKFKQGLGLSR